MSPARMDKIETSTRIVLAYVEALNRQDIAAALACWAEDCRLESGDGTIYQGKAEIGAFLQSGQAEKREIEEIFGMGFRCIVRWKTQDGQRGAEIFRVQDGLICEQLSYLKS